MLLFKFASVKWQEPWMSNVMSFILMLLICMNLNWFHFVYVLCSIYWTFSYDKIYWRLLLSNWIFNLFVWVCAVFLTSIFILFLSQNLQHICIFFYLIQVKLMKNMKTSLLFSVFEKKIQFGLHAYKNKTRKNRKLKYFLAKEIDFFFFTR